jgi:hypothetical protein
MEVVVLNCCVTDTNDGCGRRGRRRSWRNVKATASADRPHMGMFEAARSGCTSIPLVAGRAQEDETILVIGCSSHVDRRFVHLDAPRLIGSQ